MVAQVLAWLLPSVTVVSLVVHPLAAQDAPQGLPCPECPPTYAVAVWPDAEVIEAQASVNNSVSFTVMNTGTNTVTFTFSCSVIGSETCVSVSPTSKTLSPGQDWEGVTVTFQAGAAGTSGTVKLTAYHSPTGVSDDGSYNVSNVPGPAPVVDVTPYNSETQDLVRCAASCFAVAYAQSTVPYFSLDAPRSVTLAYHGDRVDPKPFIHVNVQHGGSGSNLPTVFWLEAKKSDGTFITFLNGETKLRFAPSTTRLRLAGQFNAIVNGVGQTGVYGLDIIVTAEYTAGTRTVVNSKKLAIVNENASPIARGWTVAGVQRLYLQTDSSALIADGAGSAVFFQKSGVSYTTPVSEFSKLVTGAPSGSGWTRLFPDSTKVVFNTAGRMIEVRDRFNNIATITYDGSNRVSQVKDPLNLAITLSYDANGLTAIQDPAGRLTDVTVDASKRLTTIRDPDNVSMTFGYDASLRLSTISDRGGAVTTLGYHSASGKLTSVTAAPVPVQGQGTVSPVTALDPWQHKGVPYGSTGTPFATLHPDSVRGSVTAPGGATTRFTVNRFGQPLVTRLPLGQWAAVTYNAAGQPWTVTGSSGSTASYGYDGLGQLTSVNDNGLVTTIRYGGWGQPDSILAPTGVARRFFLGTNGRVDSVRVGPNTSQSITRFRYDPFGRPDSVVDAMGHLLARTWYSGVNSNRSKDSLPGGRVATYGYAAAIGRLESVNRTAYPTTQTVYDVLNRPTHFYDGVNPQPTVYGYDNRFLRNVTDPKGQVYSSDYNALGWVTRRIDPAGARDTLEYNRDGAVLRRTTRRSGLQLAMTYDSLMRPLQKTGTAGQTPTESWSYSSDGRVLTGTSPVSTETIYSNARGQPDSVKTVLAGRTYWRRYAYRPDSRLDSLRATATGSGATFSTRAYRYASQAAGALDSIRFNGAWTLITPNADGLPTVVIFPGEWEVRTIPTTNHAIGTIQGNGGTEAFRNAVWRQMLYGSGGQLALVYGEGGIPPSMISKRRHLRYDGLGRLRGDTVVFGENGQVETAHEYSYDPVANRTSQGGQYTPNGGRIQAFGSCSYTTQSDGTVASRTCSGTQVTFVWHAEERLAEVHRNGVVVLLHYDAFDRLVRYDSAGVVHRHFLWDGGNLFAELDAAGNKITEFSYYPGLDRLHAFILAANPGQAYYAHSDAMGNVVALTNQWGDLERTYRYDAWGKLIGGTDTYGFAGRDRVRWKGAPWFDLGADVYYMRARWYEVHSGRFLSEDPIGLAGGINPYVYAGADPILGRDPTGLGPDCYWDWYYAPGVGIVWMRVCPLDPITVTATAPTGMWGLEGRLPPYLGSRAFQDCDDPAWSHPLCDDGAPEPPTNSDLGVGKPRVAMALRSSSAWTQCKARNIQFTGREMLHGTTGTWELTFRKRIQRNVPVPIPRTKQTFTVPVDIGIYSGGFTPDLGGSSFPAFGQVFCRVGLGLFEAVDW